VFLAGAAWVRYCRKAPLNSWMEHSCHKCGQPVEDGLAFCAHCGAPQIRVLTPEPPSARPAAETDTYGRDSVTLPRMDSSGAFSAPLRWKLALRPCAVAGVVACVSIALRLVFPVALLGAGLLAVGLYRRRTPGMPIKAGTGAQLGAVSGLICFGILGAFVAVALLLTDVSIGIHGAVLEAIGQAAARSNDQQVQAAIENFKSPQGFAVLMAFGVVFLFLLFVVLGSIGGAVGAVILSRRDKN
jgi:hypothetical protein